MYSQQDVVITQSDATIVNAPETPHESLSSHVERAVRQYFKTLEDVEPSNLYDIMLTQLEKPLLSVVLEQTRGNQSKTAEILGLNRGTLRKKLKIYNLM